MVVGTIANFVKTMSLTSKFEQRQKSWGLSKDDSFVRSYFTQSPKQIIATRVAAIVGKLKAGQLLSGEDFEFLRVNSPEYYRKAVQILNERKNYREQLKRCKTKEEVQRLHTGKMQQFAHEAKTISGSNTEAGQQDALEFVQMRMAAISDEHTAFTRELRYQKLPSESQKSTASTTEKKRHRLQRRA